MPASNFPSSRLLGLSNSLILGLLTCAASLAASLATEPFIPSDPALVLLKTSQNRMNPQPVSWKKSLLAWRNQPNDPAIAQRYALENIERYRAESDPRYLGFAEAALLPWKDVDQAPPGLLVLRATIRQSLHDYSGCMLDLEQALSRDPSNGQAWLTRSVVAQIQGNYDQARRDQWQLFRHCPPLMAATAATQLASLTGKAAEGRRLLETQLAQASSLPATQLAWAMTVAAECALRAGQETEAEHWFQKAAVLGVTDLYRVCAHADFLIAKNRFEEAARLLEESIQSDAALLRQVVARMHLNDISKEFRARADELDRRMSALEAREDKSHRREQGLYQLHVRRQASEAVRFALENWENQKEPADLELLLSSANASRNVKAAAMAIEWIDKNHQRFPAWTESIRAARELVAGSKLSDTAHPKAQAINLGVQQTAAR